MQKITPFLWFDNNAEQAAKFYVSIFKDSKILGVSRYGKAGPGKRGSVMSVSFRLEGLEFTALNGGPVFTFSPAISFFVSCKTQKEVDHYWNKLSKGGEQQQCGWLKDKFGVTWQIVPTALGELFDKPGVMEAMLRMDKLDIKRLQEAARAPAPIRKKAVTRRR